MTDNTLPDLQTAVREAHDKINKVRAEVGRFIFGQDKMLEQALIAVLSNGHTLLVGVPGLAKTKLVTTLAKVMGFDTKRIQCTPDLMPTDIIGSEILEEVDYGRRNFRFIPGPIFAQLLMVDEINRASPRTQSALLQAMQEKNVTVVGREHPLPSPFLVMATQNPIEQEGTFPLPEAQLDRFMLQISIDYPDRAAEKAIIDSVTKEDILMPQSLIFPDAVKAMQGLVRQIVLEDKITETILNFMRAGRPGQSVLPLVNDYVAWGPGPRACQALAIAMRANALIHGRAQASMEDFHAMLGPVLHHRMALNYRARVDGVSLDQIIKAMSAALPAT